MRAAATQIAQLPSDRTASLLVVNYVGVAPPLPNPIQRMPLLSVVQRVPRVMYPSLGQDVIAWTETSPSPPALATDIPPSVGMSPSVATTATFETEIRIPSPSSLRKSRDCIRPVTVSDIGSFADHCQATFTPPIDWPDCDCHPSCHLAEKGTNSLLGPMSLKARWRNTAPRKRPNPVEWALCCRRSVDDWTPRSGKGRT